MVTTNLVVWTLLFLLISKSKSPSNMDLPKIMKFSPQSQHQVPTKAPELSLPNYLASPIHLYFVEKAIDIDCSLDEPCSSITMAANVALNALFVRLGFSQAASDILTDPAQQNMSLEVMKQFEDDECKTLCQNLRRPGGTIAGPNGNIPNPGVAVSAQAEINLKVACFMVRHYDRVDRAITAAAIDNAALTKFNVYRREQLAYKEPATLLKLKKGEKMIRYLEAMAEHIHLYNGIDGSPLSYIIRDDAVVPAAATDPPFGSANNASRYKTLRDEIRCRATQTGERYHLDNARVFTLLNESLADFEDVLTWMHDQVAGQDGRAAWIALKAHYLGSTELETLEVLAEKRLDSHTYRGEKPRYTFEHHISIHRRAHLDIQRTTGVAMTEQVKVRKLLKSLAAPFLMTPIATIRANPNLRGNFDEAVNFIRGFITTTSEMEPRVIAANYTEQIVDKKKKKKKGGDSKKGSGGGRKGNNTSGANNASGNSNSNAIDRYYKPQEWRKLSQDVRDKVLAIRAKKKRAVSEIKTNDDADTKNSSDEEENGHTQRKVKSFRVSQDSSEDEADGSDDE